MKVTGHEVTGVILAPVTSVTFFFTAWMVRYYRRRRLRRRARPLRRYRRPRYNLSSRRRSSRKTPRATRVVTRTFKVLTNNTRAIKWDDAQGEGAVIALKLAEYSTANDEASHYDQYRINWAKFSFKPSGTLNGPYQDEIVENGLSVGKLGPPMIGAYVDHDDDATVPSSINACITRGGKMATWPNKLTMKWKPRPLTMLYESTATTAYGLRSRSTWVDCTDTACPHYGLKSYLAYPHVVDSSKTYKSVWHWTSLFEFSVSFRNKLGYNMGNI